MFSVAVNGLKTFSTLHHESSFTEHIALVRSNEDARISASDMSEMSLVIKPKASRIWMSFVVLTFL